MIVTKKDKALLRRMKLRQQTSHTNPEWVSCLSLSEQRSAVKLARMGMVSKQRLRTGHVVVWISTGEVA